jgi:hypothetical protein
VAVAGWQWQWWLSNGTKMSENGAVLSKLHMKLAKYGCGSGNGWVAVDVAVGKWLSNGTKMSKIGLLLSELCIIKIEFAEKVAVAVGVAVVLNI